MSDTLYVLIPVTEQGASEAALPNTWYSPLQWFWWIARDQDNCLRIVCDRASHDPYSGSGNWNNQMICWCITLTKRPDGSEIQDFHQYETPQDSTTNDFWSCTERVLTHQRGLLYRRTLVLFNSYIRRNNEWQEWKDTTNNEMHSTLLYRRMEYMFYKAKTSILWYRIQLMYIVHMPGHTHHTHPLVWF